MWIDSRTPHLISVILSRLSSRTRKHSQCLCSIYASVCAIDIVWWRYTIGRDTMMIQMSPLLYTFHLLLLFLSSFLQRFNSKYINRHDRRILTLSKFSVFFYYSRRVTSSSCRGASVEVAAAADTKPLQREHSYIKNSTIRHRYEMIALNFV